MDALAQALKERSPIADWCERCLDLSNPKASADHDELFVSCRQFCEAVGVPADERPSYSAFGRAMTDMGFALERVPGGASIRRGCRIRRKAALASLLDEEAAVDTFLAERCSIAPRGSRTRTRSLELHDAYCRWAAESGRDAIGIKRFARQMELLGLRRTRSDGIWWQRVALLHPSKGVGSNDTLREDTSPRPIQGADDASGPDMGGAGSAEKRS
ncbi:hypothetical protein [Aurantiacibacter hainanensis]|uniref:hypothetical protein n=1 Tax=Aurantiacibacter hainanensis TaxID=3076114 RepID=UPI0030C6B0EF